MPDFRFEGILTNGRVVQGVISADSRFEAKQRLRTLAKKRNFKVTSLKRRRTFIYKVQRGDEKPVSGEQKAFSKEEVEVALRKLGYRVLSVQPKVLDFKFKPPATEIVTFVRVSADLLREQLPYTEVLQLLINDIQHPGLREAIKEVNNDLKMGRDSEEAFQKQEKTLGRFTARMLGLAAKSGNMTEIYESTAKFLERNAEFRKNLRSALIMPLFTLLILFGAVIFYVAYIFPETAELFLSIGAELPPMTAATLKLSHWLQAHVGMLSGVTLAIVIALVVALKNSKMQLLRDRLILKIPVIGPLIHKTCLEIFCRVFNALYSGSGENIDALRLAAEASGNKYIEHQIKTQAIPLMLKHGKGLVEGLEASGVFTKTALARFHSGAETGTVKQAALQIANYYEKETVYKLKNAIEFIQIIIAMIIMVVLTALTLISAETATVTPKMNY
ncbi:MAG: type II secretion system F family protein [Calditrichaeota bacterium]|nr:MAG: type II secretion system F family protein [Calditrichota bacterium]